MFDNADVPAPGTFISLEQTLLDCENLMSSGLMKNMHIYLQSLSILKCCFQCPLK